MTTLLEENQTLKSIIVNNDSQIKKLNNQVIILNQQVASLKNLIFASKSEKITPADKQQGLLFDEIENTLDKQEPTKTVKVKSHRRKKRNRKPIPDSIPRKEVVLDLSDEEKICECGCNRVFIGEDISEKIDIIPEQIFVWKYIIKKYACKKCEGLSNEDKPAVRKQSIPANIIPQSRVSVGLLAHIITRKFEYALPLYRQEKIFSRLGFDISRVSMSQWCIKASEKLDPLIDLMKEEIRSGPTIGIDETRIQVMKELDRKNTQKSWMWVFISTIKKFVIFEYHRGRGGNVPQEFLKDFEGNIITDDYGGYSPVNKSDKITHALCWAHARRKFFEAAKEAPENSESHWYLNKIGKLYRVEKIIRDQDLSPVDILKIRERISKPVIEEIFEACKKHLSVVRPSSLIATALKYIDKSEDKFKHYLADATIPIDNNPTENAIRPFVLGRKNWLFSGSPRGAKASAILYSIIESAKMNGHDPYWYLRFVLEQLCSDLTEQELRDLLPSKITVKQLEKYKQGVLA